MENWNKSTKQIALSWLTGRQKPIITIIFSQSILLYSLRNIKVCIEEKKFTDYNGHAWPMCATSPQCENTFGMPLVHHRAELALDILTMGFFSGVLSPCVILRSSACTFCHTGMFCRRVPKNVSLFSSNIVIHTSSSLDVCIGVCECTRALCCVVLLSPLQIRIKMNLFCILGRL